jgi:hypothetical protein
VRARHLLLLWQTITVDTADLRYGYEAISRYLAGGHPGFALIDSRRRRRAPGLRLRPDPAVSSTLRKR